MLSTADFKRKINPDKAREEWPLIRDKMWELSKGLSQPLSKREFVDKFYSLGLQDEFPTFDFFIQSEGIIGMSSCAHERVFSGLTTVKTDKRDGMQIDAVDTHVGMYMSGQKRTHAVLSRVSTTRSSLSTASSSRNSSSRRASCRSSSQHCGPRT